MFVTSSHYDKLSDEIAKLQARLETIQSEKSHAWEHCGDAWHDNPYYNHLLGEERGIMAQLRDLTTQIHCATIIDITADAPQACDCVKLCTRVVIHELNISKGTERTREISVVPIGAEDIANDVLSYVSPYANALMGKEPGEAVEMKLPSGELEITIVEIKKF
jgi:transcription elongation factor GreA